MTTWVIGDVQGCHTQLLALLQAIDFDANKDSLWLTGDLVNRGPESLETLRFVHSSRAHIRVVLGNHDLHLLASSVGARKPARGDTLDAILTAPDCDALLHWLRHQPLVHQDPGLDWTMVHAGIPPEWTVAQAVERSQEVQSRLQRDDWPELMHQMYGNKPSRWRNALRGAERLRFIINAFTRMRYLDATGRLDFDEKRPPGEQAPYLQPWYELRRERGLHERIVFGHWATLQVRRPVDPKLPLRHVDHGCVWGGRLVAFALETGIERSVPGLGTPRAGFS